MPAHPDEFDLLNDAFASIRQVRAVETDTRKCQDGVDEIVRLLQARIANLPVSEASIASVVAAASHWSSAATSGGRARAS